jgi:hypothetical protein
MIKINFERVAQLLADELFKSVVLSFFLDDLKELAMDDGRPGMVVLYVATAICTEMDFPADKIEPWFGQEEGMIEFMKQHKGYISDIILRVIYPMPSPGAMERKYFI